jgi:perosamine synthetase
MIPHSQPYISSSLSDRINSLLINKDFQSDGVLDRINSIIKNKFHLDNIYFTQKGSHALYWIIKGLDLSCEDEVIMPTYLCSSVYQATLATGVKPVLCDIGSDWHMSRQTVEEKITKNTKAIIIVNLFGMYLDCSEFRYPGVTLINDLCQSFNILCDTTKDHGDFAFYSFHPTKFITAGGGGGFSVINPNVKFKNFLGKEKLDFSVSNINLLILEEQLNLYDAFVTKRKKIADIYFSSISEEYTKHLFKKNNTFYRFPLIQEFCEFSKLQAIFEEKKIAVRRGVDQLIHRIVDLSDDDFPNAVRTYNTNLSIPIYPSLKIDEAQGIARVVSEVMNG